MTTALASPAPIRTEALDHPGVRTDPLGAPARKAPLYLPTLFDRLCDDDPAQPVDDPQQLAASRRRLRELVLRDLQVLLNTTNLAGQFDAQRYPAVAESTLNFGVPPLAGGYLSERRWSDMERLIRRAIENFEPRLLPQTLVVRPLTKDRANVLYNVLTFEISGHIRMSPYPLEFMVQSAVDLESNRIELRPA